MSFKLIILPILFLFLMSCSSNPTQKNDSSPKDDSNNAITKDTIINGNSVSLDLRTENYEDGTYREGWYLDSIAIGTHYIKSGEEVLTKLVYASWTEDEIQMIKDIHPNYIEETNYLGYFLSEKINYSNGEIDPLNSSYVEVNKKSDGIEFITHDGSLDILSTTAVLNVPNYSVRFMQEKNDTLFRTDIEQLLDSSGGIKVDGIVFIEGIYQIKDGDTLGGRKYFKVNQYFKK